MDVTGVLKQYRIPKSLRKRLLKEYMRGTLTLEEIREIAEQAEKKYVAKKKRELLRLAEKGDEPITKKLSRIAERIVSADMSWFIPDFTGPGTHKKKYRRRR